MVHVSSDVPFIFNNPLYFDCIVLPYTIIETLLCCTGTMFVAETLAFMRWLPDLVSAMPLPWECCVEEVGGPVVSTSSELCWIKFVLLLTVVLTAP